MRWKPSARNSHGMNAQRIADALHVFAFVGNLHPTVFRMRRAEQWWRIEFRKEIGARCGAHLSTFSRNPQSARRRDRRSSLSRGTYQSVARGNRRSAARKSTGPGDLRTAGAMNSSIWRGLLGGLDGRDDSTRQCQRWQAAANWLERFPSINGSAFRCQPLTSDF